MRALVIVEVQTGRLTIPRQGYHTWQVGPPRWAPDGERIATAYTLGGISGIAVFDLTPGSAEKARAHTPTGVVGVKDRPLKEISHTRLLSVDGIRPHPGGGPFFRPGYPSWYSFGSAAPAWLDKRFYGLSWSPDGKQLAFSSDLDPSGTFQVYTMPVLTDAKEKPAPVPGSSSAWPQEVRWGTR